MAVFGNSNDSEDKKLKKVEEVQFPNPHGNIKFDLRYNNPISLNEVEGILDYVESQAPPKTIIEADPDGGELEGYEIKPSKSMDEQEILLDENENLKAATAVWEFNYPSPIYNLPDEPPERFKQSDTFPPKGKAFTHIYGFEF